MGFFKDIIDGLTGKSLKDPVKAGLEAPPAQDEPMPEFRNDTPPPPPVSARPEQSPEWPRRAPEPEMAEQEIIAPGEASFGRGRFGEKMRSDISVSSVNGEKTVTVNGREVTDPDEIARIEAQMGDFGKRMKAMDMLGQGGISSGLLEQISKRSGTPRRESRVVTKITMGNRKSGKDDQ